MPTAPANDAGIELYYETFGDPDGVPLLFIMGLGAQLLSWDPELMEAFVDRGFYCIRFDNRDVGLSTKAEVGELDVMASIMAAMGGEPVDAPYLLKDMADDAASLLDHLDLPSAHVVGASMGGMIAQALAIGHSKQVRSLTSIMSTTGDPDVGQPSPEIMGVLLAPAPSERAAAIESGVAASRAIASPDHFDEAEARARSAAAYDRCFYPRGFGHQLLAIVASGSRSDDLRQLDVPTLVVHGDADPLVTPSGGQRTAEVVPGAELLVMEGMGHDLPQVFWPQLVEAVTTLAARADDAR